LVELAGQTLGVVGYGSIGRQVAALARAFGMSILAAARKNSAAEEGVTFVHSRHGSSRGAHSLAAGPPVPPSGQYAKRFRPAERFDTRRTVRLISIR
jgi:hypothetical protein